MRSKHEIAVRRQHWQRRYEKAMRVAEASSNDFIRKRALDRADQAQAMTNILTWVLFEPPPKRLRA